MSSSQNGKGDKLRKGANLNAYWQNYDSIFRRQTWQEWAKELGETILDPDGFDRTNPDKKYSRRQFDEGLPHCTRITTWTN